MTTNEVTRNCLHLEEVLAESSVYLSSDPSGIARMGAATSPDPAFNQAYLSPLGWSSVLSIFTGIAAFFRGKSSALEAGKCQDLTSKRMGQIQMARGVSEVLCGISYIPIRFSQTIKQIKMVYFKPLFLGAMALILVLYVLLAIPIIYRICLYAKIRKQVAKMTPENQLKFYKERLGAPPEIESFDKTRQEVTKAHIFAYIAAGEHPGPEVLERKVQAAFEEYEKRKVDLENEHQMKKLQLRLAFGPDAIKLIAESPITGDVAATIKQIDYAKGLYIFILALAVTAIVIGLGAYAYTMDMGGIALIQNYGALAVSALFFVADLYGFIQDLKHLELKKEKCLTLALTALVFIASLVLYLHHGHASLVSNLIFYSVLSFWAAQMVVLFGAALYKRNQEKQKALCSI